MKRVLTVTMMAVASVPAALIMLVGFCVIEAVHAYRRANTTLGRVKVTKADRERFNADLQELEFATLNMGPSLLIDGKPVRRK